MDVRSLWAGLDLGLERSNLCVVDAQGAVLKEQECSSKLADVEEALAPFAPAISLLAVEAGTNTHLVRGLRERGYPVGIFEARKASKFLAIRRSKTDASDAHGLADLGRLGRHTVSQVHLKSVEFQQLRSEILLRHKLLRMRVAAEVSLRSRLAMYGRRLPAARSASGLRRQADAEIAALRTEQGIDLAAHLEPLVTTCHSLRKYLASIDHELEQRARSNPVCERFMEIPGVGWLSALSFFSAIEDPHRFAKAEDVAAYLGLVPRRYQSGDVSRSLGITKSGNKLTRMHLVTAAGVMRMGKVDCALRDWGLVLKDRCGAGRSRVAMARKLAVVMLTMWRRDAAFEPYPEVRLGSL